MTMPAETSERSAPSLPRRTLLRMAQAGCEVVECMRALHDAGSNPVAEVLRGHGDFTELEHYPPNDVYDPRTHAQYYFHAHPPGDRDQPDFGHFHTFLRPKGMPDGVRPARRGDAAPPSDDDGPSHLVAISMSPAGMPERLFTTNRWVTGETWYEARGVIAMLDRFSVGSSSSPPDLDRWLTAMLVLFRPQIERLLIERDVAVERWRADHPGTDAFEDRRMEIASSLDISLRHQIAWLDRELDEAA